MRIRNRMILCLVVFLLLLTYTPNVSGRVSSVDPAQVLLSKTAIPPSHVRDIFEIKRSILENVEKYKDDVLSFLIFNVEVENISFSDNNKWAVADLVFINKDMHEVIATEPGLAIAQKTTRGWEVALQANPKWDSWLSELPNMLMSDEAKNTWFVGNTNLGATTSVVFGNYKLPWPNGQVKTLTQSVSHVPAAEKFAYDFADGTMFEIRASKAGTVKYAVWTYPDGYNDGNCNHANYIVLQDTTTSPVSYMLYLHLKSNSIPADKRVIGASVNQGDMIGYADDTGCSTGHHLHFQVHTNVSSWYGTSQDITFSDVSINGGRPRTPAEASSYGGQGQTTYTSGNGSASCQPPALSSPSDGATVNSRGVTFDWNDANCSGRTGYTLHVTTGSGPEDGIIEDKGVGPSDYAYTFPRDGTFYWHVATLYNGQRSAWSSRRIVVSTSQPNQCSYNAEQIILYSGANFDGTCVTLNIGEYANPGSLGPVGNDNTRSVRVGGNVQAILCNDDNYMGGCDTFISDDANLADNGVRSYTSSAKVERRPTTPAIPALSVPSNGSTLPADHDLTFAWNAASGASQYLLEWWGGPYSTMQPCGWSTATSCHIGQIARGYSYSWHVKARNSTGNESGWSDTWGFSTKLSTPANLQAQPVSCSQINLSWTDNVGGEDGFVIFQNDAAIGSAGANSTSYQSTGLNPSTAYSYTIKAFKGTNVSDASNTATANTSACAQPPSAEFDAWPQSGQAPLTVAMHIVSTDNISSCAWDYGDGTSGTSCDSLHDHVYANPGSYTVRLGVAGPGGTDDQTRSNYISVFAPACDDAFEPDDDTAHLHDFPLNTTETHAFCQANDQDWVALYAVAGAIYRIETLNLTAGTDTVLELYQGDDSSPLRVDDDGNGGQASLITWQPTSSDTYYLKVRDYRGTGDPHHTYDLRITASTAPQPPSNMAAGNATATSVSFSWQDNSQDETGFNVYKWGFDGSSWEFRFLAAVGPNVTTFTDTGLGCGGDYFYNVSAYNAIGESSRADWIKVSTSSCAPPTAAFDASPQTGNAPLTVTLRNNSAGDYTSCFWDYGDGSTGSSCESMHSHGYTTAGSYTVQLTVTGPGGSHTQSRANYIVVANAPPAARLINGDFELDADGNGRPDAWSTNTSFTTSAAAKHGGSYAGRHFATSNASYTIAQPVGNFQAGKSYSFKAFVNIPATKDSFTFKLVIKWADAKGKTLRTDTVKSYTKTTGTSNGGWSQATGSYKAPSGVAKAEVQMVVSSLNATVYVDDMTFN